MPTTKPTPKPVNPKTLITVPAGRAIIALGRSCWGRGLNAAEAIRQAKKEGGPTPHGWLLLNADAEAYVDDMGGVCWKQSADRPVELGYVR